MICVPIACATNDEIVREAQAAMHADVIELRIDSLREEPDLTYLLASITKPVIVTNRVESEGGKARKSDARIAVLCEACSLGAAYVDIEYASGAILLDNVLKAKGQTKVIVSHHDFSGVPDGLERLYERMKKEGRLRGKSSGDNVDGTTNIIPAMSLDALQEGLIAFCRSRD